MKSRDDGFTLVELLVATTISLIVVAAALSLLGPNQLLFQTQPELMDMQQRIRGSADALMRDVVVATDVAARRIADSRATIRPDALWIADGTSAHAYYLDARTRQLRYEDDSGNDTPVADNVVGLRFDLVEDAGLVTRVLVNIRVQTGRPDFRGTGPQFAQPGRTRVSARYVPDAALSFGVTLRNAVNGHAAS